MSGYKKFLGPEDKLQIAVNANLTAAYPTALFCHVPNEGKRSPLKDINLKN